MSPSLTSADNSNANDSECLLFANDQETPTVTDFEATNKFSKQKNLEIESVNNGVLI